MSTNKYSNKERYDKVIAKTKWCSFLCLTVYNDVRSAMGLFVTYYAHL